jgi:hypothetical protein
LTLVKELQARIVFNNLFLQRVEEISLVDRGFVRLKLAIHVILLEINTFYQSCISCIFLKYAVFLVIDDKFSFGLKIDILNPIILPREMRLYLFEHSLCGSRISFVNKQVLH